jgi:sulfoxide reductase heme-binding subunit YedZ
VKHNRPTILQILVHAGGIIPLVLLAFQYYLNDLSANPILDLEHRTGRLALLFLVLSLACTPLSVVSGWKEPIKRRKALGLYGALYASIHFLIFVSLDYGFDFGLIFAELTRRPFVIVGAVALLILIPLAITSTKSWVQKLGPNWKRLHRLVYILSPLVIIHYFMVVKGNLFRLQGNYQQPMIYAGLVIILLILRIPAVKNVFLRKINRNNDSPNNP